MTTAIEYAEQMAKEGIISGANVLQAERFLLRNFHELRTIDALKWTISELEALNEAHGQDERIEVQLQEAKKCLR
jgi:hypothetical protein